MKESHGISWIPRSQVMSKRRAQFKTMGLCPTGICLLFVALIVFFTQGSQIRVTATVLFGELSSEDRPGYRPD